VDDNGSTSLGFLLIRSIFARENAVHQSTVASFAAMARCRLAPICTLESAIDRKTGPNSAPYRFVVGWHDDTKRQRRSIFRA